jgi:hypothetical protein
MSLKKKKGPFPGYWHSNSPKPEVLEENKTHKQTLEIISVN